MATGRKLYEDERVESPPDPEETPIQDRRLFTQPYDLVLTALLDQIRGGTLHLRPLSGRPSFQRRYVWTDKLASKLIESIFLNVPIPPCYLSQNEEFELDVIDGQQRIYSIFRFADNQLTLTGLEVLTEYDGKKFFELPKKLQRQFVTYTLRCVIITNDSHPEIKFDVFERLNTNTVPLNAQEIRNCIYRGALVDLLGSLAEYEPWLRVLGRKEPDTRMIGEELILRFFAFTQQGLTSYRTPQKHWLNDMAKAGRRLSNDRVVELETLWKASLENSLIVFSSEECFRRLPLRRRGTINRALMDLTMTSLAALSPDQVHDIAGEFRTRYERILVDSDFSDLITRAIDHKSRTLRRFALWAASVTSDLIA